jgi:single-stranded-DNA-specific exonuclease
MKKWQVLGSVKAKKAGMTLEDVKALLLHNRGLTTKAQVQEFLTPPNPLSLTPEDVGINPSSLKKALERIKRAVEKKESIVVYADYDADGITAGAILWETLYRAGARVMPYIPHREKEGYGLSSAGIDAVQAAYNPTLIITVDHGITAWEKVAYAASLGIDVIVTDHHVPPKRVPDCTIVHTTKLSGAGVSWFVAKEIIKWGKGKGEQETGDEITALAAIGTIADMVPLVGANRAIAKSGLAVVNATRRVGLLALLTDAGLSKGAIGTYEISHMIAPRLNAMGRLEHALDALRLLCTGREDKAAQLARKLGLTNKERQQLTIDTAAHAASQVGKTTKKLLFITSPSYNQGVIGLVAGKLVEQYYRPAIVVAQGDGVSKGSARSIPGFNIVEAIRTASDLLVDVGGHPMAAGFTVETKNIEKLKEHMENIADKQLTNDDLTRVLRIDAEIPLEMADEKLWETLRAFEPYGFGNAQPIFATRGATVGETRLVGAEGKHLKMRILTSTNIALEAIAFGMGSLYGKLQNNLKVDIAYTLDMNEWNGKRSLQLKMRDIQVPS